MNHRPAATYTDSALMEMVRRGEEHAFTELFLRYWQSLYEKANNALQNPAVSKDIVQDIFFSIWVRRAELDILSVKGYLEQATRYQVFKAIRDKKAGLQMQERLAAITVDIMQEAPYLLKEHEELLEYLIDRLPGDWQETFRLSRKDLLTYPEIAKRLHISERSVEYRIAKSLEFFRTNFCLSAG